MSIFQSTLPARGATSPACLRSTKRRISIHAPRTGSDEIFVENQAGIKHFNPRSPHGERPSRTHFCPLVVQFQSTLPARGATRRQSAVSCFKSISIHAPRTGSDGITPPFGQAPFISIHAPRTGSDPRGGDERGGGMAFQSTLPARGATANVATTVGISVFQSTLPARGATS